MLEIERFSMWGGWIVDCVSAGFLLNESKRVRVDWKWSVSLNVCGGLNLFGLLVTSCSGF